MFNLIKNIIGILFIFAVGYLFGVKGVRFYQVVSGSMEPTIETNDKIIGINVSSPKRDDIVAIIDPQGGNTVLIKRIIGLPGDTILIKDGDVFINEEKISEPYIKEKPAYNLKAAVPQERIFVLGDNRNNSSDSHVWGSVPVQSIKSKIIMIYWPFQRFSFLSSKPKITISLR